MRLVRFRQRRQELTSQPFLLRFRLQLFDAVVTPTMTFGAGTGPQQKNTKKCSALPSAECFVSSFRRRENSTIKIKETLEEKTFEIIRDDEMTEDTQEEDSTNGEYDEDSSISLEYDADSTASQEDRLEDWNAYIKKPREKLMKTADTQHYKLGRNYRRN